MANPASRGAQAAGREPHAIPDVMAEPESGADQKYTKDEVSYRNAGQSPTRCVFCAHYQPSYGTNTCALVEGPINPGDVCDLYAPANEEPSSPSEGGSITDLVGMGS